MFVPLLVKNISRTACYWAIFREFYFGRSWNFWNLIFSITFRSNHLFEVETGWVSPAQARFPANNLFAMQDVESKRSSGFYSEVCVDQEQQVVDEPDFANISQCIIDRLVFGEHNQERPPFCVNFCSGDDLKLDRSLLVILIHHLVILVLVIFCITFFTFCEADNRFPSEILALLTACLGHILHTPRWWTSE